MDDKWKGEHLIRSKKLDLNERHSRNSSITNSVLGEKRRQLGVNPTATKSVWSKSFDNFFRRKKETKK